MTLQVCDVNQGLLSVRKMVEAGNRVVFENDNMQKRKLAKKSSGDWLIPKWRAERHCCGAGWSSRELPASGPGPAVSLLRCSIIRISDRNECRI